MISQIIDALQGQLNEHAHSALAKPKSRDAYEYGYAVGVYAGIQRALNAVNDVISKDEEDDRGRNRRDDRA